MELIHTDTSGGNDLTISEKVYDSLLGQLIPEYHLSWVENIFVPGHPCYESYLQMQTAYYRLLARLQETDEDADAEEMINCLLEHGRIIGQEMFRCGQQYQKMLDNG